MQIKTDFRTIRGEHNGVPFELENGILKINGYTFSKDGIKLLVEISNLLSLEGFSLVDKLPMHKRYTAGSWPFDELRGYPQEEG